MIIEGKRVLGLEAFKALGRQDYCLWKDGTICFVVVEVDSLKPQEERFHYCSIVSQPIFMDFTERAPRPSEGWRPVSWRKIPEAWKKFLKTYIENFRE